MIIFVSYCINKLFSKDYYKLVNVTPSILIRVCLSEQILQ